MSLSFGHFRYRRRLGRNIGELPLFRPAMCRTDGNLANDPDGKKAKTWTTLVHPMIVSFTNLIHVLCLNPVLC